MLFVHVDVSGILASAVSTSPPHHQPQPPVQALKKGCGKGACLPAQERRGTVDEAPLTNDLAYDTVFVSHVM